MFPHRPFCDLESSDFNQRFILDPLLSHGEELGENVKIVGKLGDSDHELTDFIRVAKQYTYTASAECGNNSPSVYGSAVIIAEILQSVLGTALSERY